MVDRICQQEGNRYRCHENPAAALEHTPAFGRTSPEAQAEIMDALTEHAGDPQFLRDVYGLVTAPGADRLTGDGWQAILGALEDHRDRGAVARLGELAGDPGFQRMSGADAADEADRAAEGVAFSARSFAGRSGVPTRERSSFSRVGASELGAHGVAEGVAIAAEHFATHGAGVVMAGAGAVAGSIAVGASSGAAVAFGVYAVLHEIAEAHHEGAVLGENVQYAQGIVDGLEHRMGGDPPGAQSAAGARGGDRADELWEQLTPAQRATLSALSPDDRRAFVEDLGRLLVERRAIAGR